MSLARASTGLLLALVAVALYRCAEALLAWSRALAPSTDRTELPP